MALPTPWAGLGAMVGDNPGHFDAHTYGRALADARGPGRSWVAYKAAHGTRILPELIPELVDRGLARQILEQGHRLLLWQWLTEDESPEIQASALVGVVRGLEGMLGLRNGDVGVLVNDEIQGRGWVATRYILRYRMLAPLRHSAVVPLGLGFLGGDGRWYPAAANLSAWRLGLFRNVVETFDGNMKPTGTPPANATASTPRGAHAVLAAHRLYFPATHLRPLLSGPWLEERLATGPHLVGEELTAAAARGAYWKGAAVFPGERLSPSGWRHLGLALRQRGLIG
jgi:hypothetical protein